VRVNPPRSVPAKPAFTIDEQIEQLARRGMRIGDRARAAHYLGHLNYYRLRGYWMRDELPAANGDHPFRHSADFDEVIRLYDFDRRLRLELNDAIERVEVSLRTRWAYVLGHFAGPVAHCDPVIFNERHAALLARLEALYADRKEVFLARYLERGEEPPIWALCEVLSLGDLSKWLRSIREHGVRQQIADPYGLAETPFCSFVEHLSYVRNVCAHHARLWNRRLVVGTLALPRKPQELSAQLQRGHEGRLRIYNSVLILLWLMDRISPGSEWRERIRVLVEGRPDLWDDMGFPQGWQSYALWRGGEE
jgi:abortive infection bacteriophage resistance protein